MTATEFSTEFDTLYNNLTSNSAPGIDEYEKSLFLTMAQEELIKNYFNPKSNKLGEGFDGSEKRQIDFSELIKVQDITASVVPPATYISIDPRAQLFLLPDEVFIITNEQVQLTEGALNYPVTVIPINYREYDRLMSKPYKEPLKRQCWRFIQANSTIPVAPNGQQMVSEIISKTGTTVNAYRVRYVKKPQPIVLAVLTTWGLSINGITAVTDCELNPIIHREILARGVEIAKAHYEAGDIQTITQINQRNE